MRFSLTALLMLLAVCGTVFAGESPRFRGPNGDGKFDETGLLKSWPDSGPPVAWVAKGLGKGYASASVSKGKIYVPGMLPDETGCIFVLDMTGKSLGNIPYGKETLDQQAPGSRSTPTIDGNRLYVISGLGFVFCIDLEKASTLWSANVFERFGGENNTWNLAESLLADGDNLICTPGGKDGGVVALNKMTGATVWATKGIDDKASYCSPTIIVHNGKRILLTETEKFLVGINPDGGALLWKHPHQTEYNIHAVTPVYDKGLVYYSGGYGSGGGVVELSADGSAITQKWTDKTLDCQHHGVVLVDGYLYGTGHNSNQLVCLEMATGKIMWQTKEVRQGVVVYADGMLYVYEGPKTGIVDLVKPQSSGFERTGKFTVTEGTDKHWAHPTITDGKLLIRHGDALVAYNLKAK